MTRSQDNKRVVGVKASLFSESNKEGSLYAGSTTTCHAGLEVTLNRIFWLIGTTFALHAQGAVCQRQGDAGTILAV